MATSPFSPKGNKDSSLVTKLSIFGELHSTCAEKVIKTGQSLGLIVAKDDQTANFEEESGILIITERFYGTHFEHLRLSHLILGPPAFLQIVQRFGKIPNNSSKALYCLAFYQQKICVTGFKKSQMIYLKNLINFMGGIVKPTIKNDISFLVTNTTQIEQYKTAQKFDIPIRRAQWVQNVWDRRNDLQLNLSDPSLESLTVSDLSVVHISFYGFGKEETQKLEEKACSLGLSVVPLTSELCTHIVINSEKAPIKPLPQESPESPCSVVVLQWFTLLCRMKLPVSVDNYCFIRPESLKKRNSGSLKRRFSRPRSSSNSETGNENFEVPSAPALQANDLPPAQEDYDEDNIPSKTSRVQSDLSCKKKLPIAPNIASDGLSIEKDMKSGETIPPEKIAKMYQRRKFKCIELYETEKNYVDILNAVNKHFKIPLEKMLADKRMLIAEQDLKTIFHKFLPIQKVHEKVLADLEPLVMSWNDNCMIGNIFVKYNSDLIKVYPQFINYMDVILQTIEDNWNSNVEFQKFLKEAESNPDCHRQGLKDLIVWPMQRIGRLILLLQGILKDTPPHHSDCQPLKKAIQLMEKCGQFVNDDKRKTENIVSQVGFFYEIQNCPYEILNIKKFFVAKYVVQEVQESETTFRKPAIVVLLLLKEYLEICKQRSKGIPGLLLQKKLPYKHVNLIPLEYIKCVALVTEPKEHASKFAIMVQPVNGAAYRKIYTVQSGTARELVQNLSTVIAKHTLKSLDEIQKDVCYADVLNYFTKASNDKKKSPEKVQSLVSTEDRKHSIVDLETPEKRKSAFFLHYTPEKFIDSNESNSKSPSSKSLPPSHKKGKLRRAFSSFLTPIQNIVTSGLPVSELSDEGCNPLEPTISMPSRTPKIRKKLKSNSFGAKSQANCQ